MISWKERGLSAMVALFSVPRLNRLHMGRGQLGRRCHIRFSASIFGRRGLGNALRVVS